MWLVAMCLRARWVQRCVERELMLSPQVVDREPFVSPQVREEQPEMVERRTEAARYASRSEMFRRATGSV